jgi:hypothetical protein
MLKLFQYKLTKKLALNLHLRWRQISNILFTKFTSDHFFRGKSLGFLDNTVSNIRTLIPVLLISSITESSFAQTFTISGKVKDAATGEALPAASIRVVGSSRGTTTNVNGNYRFSLTQGNYTLAFVFIGYKTDSLNFNLIRNLEKEIKLTPLPIQLAEVVVIGEDPAMAIMRKVIANKKKWMNALRTYQFEAFTRQVIKKDTSIASIMESYTTSYWQKGDTLREFVKQKRQTQNIPMTQDFAAVGDIVNFYEDEVNFGGFTFVGPTSQEAFDYYTFTLGETRRQHKTDIFSIKIEPRTRLTPLFRGNISIADESFALVGVEVTPNEVFTFPLISDIQLKYSQQFAIFENRYWMPVNISTSGTIKVGIPGIKVPQIGLEANSIIYDYRINETIPDTIFQKPRRLVLEEAKKIDSTFWKQHEVLPLTDEEQVAYEKLDSTQTFNKQFKPTGVIAFLGDLSESFVKYIDFRFNRVEGLFFGGSYEKDNIFDQLKLGISAGYGFADKIPKGKVSTEHYLNGKRTLSLKASVFRTISNFPDENYYSNFLIGLEALLEKDDYRDYYYSTGWSTLLHMKLMPKTTMDVGVQSVQEMNATQNTDFSVFNRDSHYRTQPSIREGMVRSFIGKVHYGDNPFPLNIIATDFAEIEWEHSNNVLLPTHSDFSRVVMRADYHTKTFLFHNLFAPTLTIKALIGFSSGNIPPQRQFILESPISVFAPVGVIRGVCVKEFSGDQILTLTVEHNFRSIPFLWLNIPFLYKNSIEIITFITVAQAKSTTKNPPVFNHSTDGWYSEAGIGISKIIGLLRIDLTRRFTTPSNWILTFGIATII